MTNDFEQFLRGGYTPPIKKRKRRVQKKLAKRYFRERYRVNSGAEGMFLFFAASRALGASVAQSLNKMTEKSDGLDKS